MSVLNELKEMHDWAVVEATRCDALVQRWMGDRDTYLRRAEDLDRAIAALEPQYHAGALKAGEVASGWETYELAQQGEVKTVLLSDEQAVPFDMELKAGERAELAEADAAVALEQLETDHALPPSADDVDVDEPVEFISDLTGDPAVEPESGLHETPDDEAQRAAAIELTADVEPVAASWIDQQTCEPVDATLRAFQDDHIVEPEPTEGYAPVTNPEADFWSRGLAPAEPEKKHRFSIFGHKRETEDA